jgi:hypothetical protein
VEGSVQNDYLKMTRVRKMKSSTWKRTQQDGEVASIFDLWNILAGLHSKMRVECISNLLPNFRVLFMKLHFLSTNVHGINYG